MSKVDFSKMFKDAEKSPHYHLANIQMDIGEAVYKKMKEKNWNKSDLARELGVSRQLTHKILKCDQNITLMTIVKIAMALGLEVELKFNDKDNPV